MIFHFLYRDFKDMKLAWTYFAAVLVMGSFHWGIVDPYSQKLIVGFLLLIPGLVIPSVLLSVRQAGRGAASRLYFLSLPIPRHRLLWLFYLRTLIPLLPALVYGAWLVQHEIGREVFRTEVGALLLVMSFMTVGWYLSISVSMQLVIESAQQLTTRRKRFFRMNLNFLEYLGEIVVVAVVVMMIFATAQFYLLFIPAAVVFWRFNNTRRLWLGIKPDYLDRSRTGYAFVALILGVPFCIDLIFGTELRPFARLTTFAFTEQVEVTTRPRMLLVGRFPIGSRVVYRNGTTDSITTSGDVEVQGVVFPRGTRFAFLHQNLTAIEIPSLRPVYFGGLKVPPESKIRFLENDGTKMTSQNYWEIDARIYPRDSEVYLDQGLLTKIVLGGSHVIFGANLPLGAEIYFDARSKPFKVMISEDARVCGKRYKSGAELSFQAGRVQGCKTGPL